MVSERSTVAELDQRMDEAVVAYLRAESAGMTPDRQEFLGRHADIAAELTRFFADRDAVARVAAPIWHKTTPVTMHSRNPAGLYPWVFGDYEVQAELGRGGMGVVYRARQYSLNRVVALKMIAAGACGGAEALTRFYNEAQAAARLQHPNVVQIFEIGEQDGQPYFAMEYVEGGSLDRRLAGQPIDAQQAARIIETLARAVHVAHQRGVIHRDLKPSNILVADSRQQVAENQSGLTILAKAGLTSLKITDFGLAKQMDTEVGTKTETGAIVGTPCYMAPEQAEGRGQAPAPTTDVYSLGAVLYELLTGRPPFRGVTRLDTLHQIVNDEPAPPTRLQSTVPRDLETICLKCLHKEPDRRYASAVELADDLRRFQNGEPIHARQAGRIEIAWRWCCRQPMLASLGASLIVALVVGGTLVTWQWWRAEDQLDVSEGLRPDAEKREKITERLRQEAVGRQKVTERLRKEAEQREAVADKLRQEAVQREIELDANYRLAHLTLKDFMTHTVERGMIDGQGLDPQRRELLVKARDYYKKFIDRKRNDPALRQELAETSGHLANITRQIGTPEEAIEDYRRALKLFEELAREDNTVPRKYSVAVVNAHLATVHATLAQNAEALAAFNRSRALLEECLKATPDDLRIEVELASTLHNIAMFHSNVSTQDKALVAFAEVRAVQKKLLAAVPNARRVLANVAATHNGMGVLLEKTNPGSDEAFAHYKEAVAIRERLALQNPGNLGMQNDLAETLCNLSSCLRSRGELKASLDSAVKAAPTLLSLVETNPHATGYRLRLALCYANIGAAGVVGGDVPRGLINLQEARKHLQILADEFPTVPDYQRRLADIFERIAGAHTRLKQHDKALDAYQQQWQIERRFVNAFPDDPRHLSNLALTTHNLGVPLEAQGKANEARGYVLQAVQLQKKAIGMAPKNERFVFLLSSHYAFLTHLERTRKDFDAAVETTRARLALRRNDAEELVAIARDFALTAVAAKQEETQARCADLALDALRQAMKAGFQDRERLRTDADFEILRGRDDFRELLRTP